MSIELIARVLNTPTGLAPTSKMVLIGLANHANPDGTKAFPSIPRLAAYAECDERTVKRHLKNLRETGWIEVVEEAHRYRPTEYRIRGDKLSSLAARGDIQGQSGVTSGASRGDTAMSPRTVIEPSIEPSLGSISFDRFYETFPRHQGKGAAKKAWVKALTKTSPEELLTSAARYRDDPNRDPEFTCLPTTWLNQERWSDEPLPSRNGRRYEGTLDRMAHDLMKGVNGDYRTNEGPGPSNVRSLPR